MKLWFVPMILLASSVAQANFVGNPVIPGPFVDTCNGCIFVIGTPWESGTSGSDVTEWSFFAFDSTPSDAHPVIGQSITPLLFLFDGVDFSILAIGQTVTITATGFQSYPAPFTVGIPVAPTYFGYRDGTASSGNEGSIALSFNNGVDDTGSGPPIMRYFPSTNLTVGQNLGPGTPLARTYSVEALAMPEPHTAIFFILGGLGLALRFRRTVHA